jgi:hypothetical protein
LILGGVYAFPWYKYMFLFTDKSITLIFFLDRRENVLFFSLCNSKYLLTIVVFSASCRWWKFGCLSCVFSWFNEAWERTHLHIDVRQHTVLWEKLFSQNQFDDDIRWDRVEKREHVSRSLWVIVQSVKE